MTDERLDAPLDIQEMGRLVGGVAHDLNNLLTAIKGLSSLALRDVARDHAIRNDLVEIEKAATRAAALTKQLLDIARQQRRTGVPSDSAASSVAAEASEGNGETTGETILVADDDESIRRLVARVLERAGYQVRQAEDATHALSLAEAVDGRVDLLLTDVVMPRSGGEELYRRIHQKWPGVRVLYMSGYTDDPVVRREAGDPEGAYLAKPFAPDVLLATVRRVLDRASHTLADR